MLPVWGDYSVPQYPQDSKDLPGESVLVLFLKAGQDAGDAALRPPAHHAPGASRPSRQRCRSLFVGGSATALRSV